MEQHILNKLGELMNSALVQEHRPNKINLSYGGDHINVMFTQFPIPSYFKVTCDEIIACDPWHCIANTKMKYQYKPLVGNVPRIEQI